MAYTQNFKSLDGTTYTIQVDGVTLPSGVTTPPLGADPFTTEEDADTDLFMPTRTQSGYLRMQSMDKTTWRMFIPASAVSEPIMLKQGSTILWQGYVQTGTYGMTYPATYEDIEIPLVCGLGVLDSFDVEVNGPSDMVTVGELLYYIFSKLTGLTWNVAFMTGFVTVVNVWLQYKLTWRNFLTASNNMLESRFTCLGLLQELCKFFGWSCRTAGQTIYFTSIADSGRNTKTITYTLAELTQTATPSTITNMTNVTLQDADFASTDHTEEYIPGIKRVNVDSELNAYDVLMEIPYEDIFRPYKYDTPPATTTTRWRNNIEEEEEIYLLYRGSLAFENEMVKITSYTEADNPNYPQCYGRFIAFDSNIDEGRSSFSWTKAYECLISEDYGNRQSSTPLFTMESQGAHILGDGVLFISGRCDCISLSPLGDFWGQALCVLKIGDYYWNGTSWTTTASDFYLSLERANIKNTDTIFNRAEYDGTGIAITTPIAGKIYFAVKDLRRNTNWYNGYFPLMDFKIGFVRDAEDDTLNDKGYKADGGNFPDDVNIDTIFSTDKTNTINGITRRCQAGYGLIYNGNVIADTITFGTTDGTVSQKPEQRIADTIAAYGATVRRVMSLSLKNSNINVAIPSSRVTLGGQAFYPVSASHNWRNNILTLKMMEI